MPAVQVQRAVNSATIEGVPGGSNLAVPVHEILDTEMRYGQDCLLDKIGLIRRRGAVKPLAGAATFTNPVSGLFQATSPDGTSRIGALTGDVSTSNFSVLSDDRISALNLDWNGTLPQAPYYVVDGKPSLGGGTLIGSSKQYQSGSAVQSTALWRGANLATYTTGTITVARGSATVTGSGTAWVANACAGMFLFATADSPAATTVYLGTVKTVDSGTQVTLEVVAPYAATAAVYSLKSLRGVFPSYAVGRITCTTSSAVVTGANTKFKDNKLDTGDWRLYRASDSVYIGTVTSVQTNIALTFVASAAVAMTDDNFYALKASADYTLDNTATGKLGFLNAVYAGRQFYANNSTTPESTQRVWFSDTTNRENVDLDPVAGNFLSVTTGQTGSYTTPIVALSPTYNALLILKENESFGLYGTTPTQFQLRKLMDDGCFSGMSVQPYNSGVIFAGRNGIYFFDGSQITNMVLNNLGDFYKSLVRTFDSSTYRMWSMIVRDHYMLFIESVTSPYDIKKGIASSTPTRMTISIYMPTQAVTFMTNMNIRGSITLPSNTGLGVLMGVNTASTGYICSATDLFETEQTDTVTCAGDTAGPSMYIESKRYSVGDSLRKKLWKEFLLHYYAVGDSLKLDTIVGLNDVGATSSSEFPATVPTWDETAAYLTWNLLTSDVASWDDTGQAVFVVKKIKFVKRGQHFGVRIYQNSASVTQARLGPWALTYKALRTGRV